MAVNPEKEKAIELAMGAVERQFGKGSIMRLGKDQPLIRDIQTISTGSISLDIALGVGGVPRGRIVEIYGPESSGKTTLCLHVVAEAQKKGGICGYIDAEHALDVGYARKLGVRTDDLLLSQPDTGEQALEIAEMLVRSGAIGVMFGNPETTTGGNALKFYASQRLDIRRIGAIKNGEAVVGSRTRVKVVKNKVAPPFKEVEFDIMYGTGISREGDLLDLASTENIVEKSGAWYAYEGERIGQGRENAKDYLRDHPEIATSIERKVLEKVGIFKPSPVQAVPDVEPDEKRARVKAVK